MLSSKHTDKHTRPYKCEAPACDKLKGFTYSGGLSRHEREVHQQLASPRASLPCPHPTCKRSTGKGFSRKENLLEHLRRVHKIVEPSPTTSSEPTPAPQASVTLAGEVEVDPGRQRSKMLQKDSEVELPAKASASTSANASMKGPEYWPSMATVERSLKRNRGDGDSPEVPAAATDRGDILEAQIKRLREDAAATTCQVKELERGNAECNRKIQQLSDVVLDFISRESRERV